MGVIMLVLFRKWTADATVIVSGPYRVTAQDYHIPGASAVDYHMPGSSAADHT